MTHSLPNWICALVCIALWLALVGWTVMKVRRENRAARERAAALGQSAATTVLVAYASQTGTAEDMAWKTAASLSEAGTPARPVSLAELDEATLKAAQRILFIVATTGEGDAPDNASGFLRRQMTHKIDLGHLNYAVLALGDSSYERYCAFGKQLDDWLAEGGAHALYPRIDVDNGNADSLNLWQQQLADLAGADSLSVWTPQAFEPWQLVRKVHLNPGSAGGEAWHLVFQPVDHAPQWEAGDIAEFALPAAEGETPQTREYSLASIPADDAAEFCVRLMTGPDGTPGLGSGWLIRSLKEGDVVDMRIRPNRSFRPAPSEAPILLIGNGTGIAGLRAHLKVARKGQAWLLFGERNRAHDNFFGDELKALQAAGMLARVDHAWSRDEGDGRYVQHLISENARDIERWIDRGAYIFVCGSLEGMSKGVHAALETVLGEERLQGLTDAGRYRRDVY
ncbi:sulfite reductase subunit alpha [uncultured Brevundimonas sp.]|uniref:sulfite reductase subunit alpha n=1 Tax=uncultured Brevundimonas sp. TaxID=213418 RepID=UPI002626AE97|nr:sulfite reductase subunit alpha [uncultured Brevundimonas sp.]